jgi:hypothetical protein
MNMDQGFPKKNATMPVFDTTKNRLINCKKQSKTLLLQCIGSFVTKKLVVHCYRAGPVLLNVFETLGN